MIVFLNGRFVPEEQAVVSAFDRGFLYGDGLFEAIRIFNGKPFRWQQHLERLQRGLEFLKFSSPYSAAELRGFAEELVAQNKMPDSLLRLTISRGVGKRGYSPIGANSPSVVLSLHPVAAAQSSNPPRWSLITSNVRLPAHEPLAQFKTCAKIPQILARAEADTAGADEALLLNNEGFVVEASSSNLFWLQDETVCTSPLPAGILPGVTRSVVLELCSKLRLAAHESNIVPKQLAQTDGVFLSLTSAGIVECASLDGNALARSETAHRLSSAYWELVNAETGSEMRR
jgi:aminodeoxychorismate lyase